VVKIPCFLCSQELQLRRDKHEKAYFVCDVCGMQIFVRGRQGNENLKQLIETLRERDFPFREHARMLYEIQAVLTEVRGLEKEIENLDNIFDVFATDRRKKDVTRVRQSLNTRIENLLSQLDRIAHADAHT
jgi:DNA-directed RNA polymerase subunit RPC12/RpoP